VGCGVKTSVVRHVPAKKQCHPSRSKEWRNAAGEKCRSGVGGDDNVGGTAGLRAMLSDGEWGRSKTNVMGRRETNGRGSV
jgi:hypothetical protein